MAMIRIRTVAEAVRELKIEDPNTSISENFVRLLCKKGSVKSFMTGNRILLDFDDLVLKINSFTF